MYIFSGGGNEVISFRSTKNGKGLRVRKMVKNEASERSKSGLVRVLLYFFHHHSFIFSLFRYLVSKNEEREEEDKKKK